MNAVHRKHVYSDRNIPHYADDEDEATHRYMSGQRWKYMVARSDEAFQRWGATFFDASHRPQKRVGGTWRDM